MQSIHFVEYDQTFLELSWLWLNDSEIKQMTNTPDFTRESQQIWYNSLKNKINYKIWGITNNGIPIGACGLKNITSLDCEYWGYIGNKAYWGKGIGAGILKTMEEKAKTLHLVSIWLQVMKINERAIMLYLKNGYTLDISQIDYIIMRKSL
ncbi:MAG: GNAT family N-acetyltransferase [Bacteroidales bacterium]|nr:GNAT family N-acetyltransferase [Bacteroidales bacterium]